MGALVFILLMLLLVAGAAFVALTLASGLASLVLLGAACLPGREPPAS